MRTDPSLRLTEEFVRTHVHGEDAWRLLEPAFRDLESQLARDGVTSDALYCVRLPGLICTALTGDDGRAMPLSVALLLVHIGTELLDDLADGDLGGIWVGQRPDTVALVAAGFCAALAPLALAQVDVPPATAATMHQTLAQGLLTMLAGQATDIALTDGDPICAGVVEASVVGKCGGALAMYATLGALLGGASAEAVQAWGEIGRCLGVAAQLRSESADLFQARESRDLAAGKRTLPIALYLDQLESTGRREALMLLGRARRDQAARDEVRTRLQTADIQYGCGLLCEVYCRRAHTMLDGMEAFEPAKSTIHRLIDRQSILQRSSEANLVV